MRLSGLPKLAVFVAVLTFLPGTTSALITVGALDRPRGAWDVEVVGGLAYVANRSLGLRVIDVSNPAAPVELGALDPPGDAVDVEVVGTLAYVADRFFGLRVIDVSNPAAPFELGALVTPDVALGVAVVGGLAYVADRFSGLRIIDFGPEYVTEIAVDLDIKPGGDPNAINPLGRGVIPAAILGSGDFDPEDVDGATLAFAPNEAAPAHDLADADVFADHLEDVNEDGLTDLVSHYRTAETGIAFGQTDACLTGETLDDRPFTGCDVIRTVRPCGIGFELVLLLPPLLWLKRRRSLAS